MKKFRLFFIGMVSMIALSVSAQTKITLTNVKTGNMVSYSQSQIDSLVYSARLADEEGEEDLKLLSIYADEYGLTTAENGYWLNTLDNYVNTIEKMVNGENFWSKAVVYVPDSEAVNAIIFDQSYRDELRIAIVQKDGLYILSNPEKLDEEWNSYIDLVLLTHLSTGDIAFYSRKKVDMLINSARLAEQHDINNLICSPDYGFFTPIGTPWYLAVKRYEEAPEKAIEADKLGEYYSPESVLYVPNSELVNCIIFDWYNNSLRIAIAQEDGLYILASPERLGEEWNIYTSTFYQFMLEK